LTSIRGAFFGGGRPAGGNPEKDSPPACLFAGAGVCLDNKTNDRTLYLERNAVSGSLSVPDEAETGKPEE